eukprot:gene9618-1822_t
MDLEELRKLALSSKKKEDKSSKDDKNIIDIDAKIDNEKMSEESEDFEKEVYDSKNQENTNYYSSDQISSSEDDFKFVLNQSIIKESDSEEEEKEEKEEFDLILEQHINSKSKKEQKPKKKKYSKKNSSFTNTSKQKNDQPSPYKNQFKSVYPSYSTSFNSNPYVSKNQVFIRNPTKPIESVFEEKEKMKEEIIGKEMIENEMTGKENEEDIKKQEIEKWRKIVKEKEEEIELKKKEIEEKEKKRKLESLQESNEKPLESSPLKKRNVNPDMIKIEIEKYENEIKSSNQNLSKQENELMNSKMKLIESNEKKQNLELKYNILVKQMKLIEGLINSCIFDEKKLKYEISTCEQSILNSKINLSNSKIRYEDLKTNLYEIELRNELKIEEDFPIQPPKYPRTIGTGGRITNEQTIQRNSIINKSKHQSLPVEKPTAPKQEKNEIINTTVVQPSKTIPQVSVNERMEKLAKERKELLQKIIDLEEKNKKNVKIQTSIPEDLLEPLPKFGNIISMNEDILDLKLNEEDKKGTLEKNDSIIGQLEMFKKYKEKQLDEDEEESKFYINPFVPFCRFEQNGVCNDKDCQSQHQRDYMDKNNNLENLKKHSMKNKFENSFECSIDELDEIFEKKRYFDDADYFSNFLKENPNDVDCWIKYAFSFIKEDYQKSLIILAEALPKNRNSIDLWMVYLNLYSSKKNKERDINISRQMFQYSIKYNPNSVLLRFVYSEFELKIPVKIEILQNGIEHFVKENDEKKSNSRIISLFYLEKIRLLCLSNELDLAIKEFENVIDYKNHLTNEHESNFYLILLSLKLNKKFPIMSNGIHLLKFIDHPLKLKFKNEQKDGYDLTKDFETLIDKFDSIIECEILCLNYLNYKMNLKQDIEGALILIQKYLQKNANSINFLIAHLEILEFKKLKVQASREIFDSIWRKKKFENDFYFEFKYFNFLKRNNFLDELKNRYDLFFERFNESNGEDAYKQKFDLLKIIFHLSEESLYFWFIVFQYLSSKNKLNSKIIQHSILCQKNEKDKFRIWIEYFRLLEEYPNEFNLKIEEFLNFFQTTKTFYFPLNIVERLIHSNLPILKLLIKIPRDYFYFNQFLKLDIFERVCERFLFDENNFDFLIHQIQKTKSIELVKKSIIQYPNSNSLFSFLLNFQPTKQNFINALEKHPNISTYQNDVSFGKIKELNFKKYKNLHPEKKK